jgi:hypothetical protein
MQASTTLSILVGTCSLIEGGNTSTGGLKNLSLLEGLVTGAMLPLFIGAACVYIIGI